MRLGKDGILLDKEEAIELCRPGAGADTCVWLVVSGKGFECLYFNRAEGRNLEGETLEQRWLAGKTVAKRDGCDMVLDFINGIKKGIQAVREGKVRPWSEIKRELGLTSEAPTVYCPKEKNAVPVWYCLGSLTQNRQQCPDLIKAIVHGNERAEVECKSRKREAR